MYSVVNIRIRTGWLADPQNFDYGTILKQAFLYVMADNDLRRAHANGFPEDLVEKLRAKVAESQTGTYYESLRKDLAKQAAFFAREFNSQRETCLLQCTGPRNSVYYLRLVVSAEGIFVADQEKKTETRFPVRLVSLDVQNKPVYPLLNQKIFQGILAWSPGLGESEAQFRLLLRLLNDNNEAKQHAAYFPTFLQLQKFKNLFIIHSKKAVHATFFLKFLAVSSSEPLENPKR